MEKDKLVAELKQVTASSEIQAAADPNKMHYDSLKTLVEGTTLEEATILINGLVEKYPDLVCDTLLGAIISYKTKLDAIKEAIK